MADHGTISWYSYQDQIEASVIAMNKRDDVVWHTLSCTPPAVGTEVVGTIDWDFRYRMMRTHTALHILCGTIWREFGVQVTGGQMYPDRARMDFAMENLNKERIAYIEQKIKDRKSTRLNSSHLVISYAVFCLKKKKHKAYDCLAQIIAHLQQVTR